MHTYCDITLEALRYAKDFWCKQLWVFKAWLLVCLLILTESEDWYFFERDAKVVARVLFERYMADISVVSIIVCKLSH